MLLLWLSEPYISDKSAQRNHSNNKALDVAPCSFIQDLCRFLSDDRWNETHQVCRLTRNICRFTIFIGHVPIVVRRLSDPRCVSPSVLVCRTVQIY